MTPSQELREHALYHYRGQLWSLPIDSAWVAAMRWLNWSFIPDDTTPTERRMFLLFVAEALDNP